MQIATEAGSSAAAAVFGVVGGLLFIAVGVAVLRDFPSGWPSRYAENLGSAFRGRMSVNSYRLGLGIGFVVFGLILVLVCSLALAS